MISKKKFIISLVVVILLTAFVTFTFGNYAMVNMFGRVVISSDDFNTIKDFKDRYAKYESLINYTKENFLYDADVDKMLDGGLKGMLNALGDPYTEYMTESEFNSLLEHTAGSFDGIGVYITPSDDNKIMIVAPIEDTPAEKAGLKTGDCIIKVNGVSYTAKQQDEAVKQMKGEPNTSVKLTILRKEADGTEKTFDIDVKREKIKIKSVKSDMIENNIGYIRITTFDSETGKDFKTEYNKLEKQGMKGLIVDLRGNPGGLIDSSVEITDMFMGEGLVTYTKTKAGEIEKYPSDKEKINIPLVLLVDEGSASASEIMSGAVKDTKAGTLIGTKTFGKGIVQTIRRFGANGAGVKMTTSEYFTPNGTNIHGKGIEPDIVVELPKDVENIGVEYLDKDTQLKKGIETIKSKLK